MNAHRLRTLFRGGNFFPATFALLFLIVVAFGFAAGGAQSQQEDTAANERKFEDTVPAHVPVKLKLKNEQKLKDLKNKGWAREFEVEVKNTGTKPIYYLYISLSFPEPELRYMGNRYGMRMAYGKSRIGIPGNVAEPDDVPILPGETITLKIPENQVRGFEGWREREGRPDPKKVEIEVVYLFFGDGTAFIGRKGRFESWPTKKRSETPHALRVRPGAASQPRDLRRPPHRAASSKP